MRTNDLAVPKKDHRTEQQVSNSPVGAWLRIIYDKHMRYVACVQYDVLGLRIEEEADVSEEDHATLRLYGAGRRHTRLL